MAATVSPRPSWWWDAGERGRKRGRIKLLYYSYKHFFYVQYNRLSYRLLLQIIINATVIFLRMLFLLQLPFLNLRLAQPVFHKNNHGRSSIKHPVPLLRNNISRRRDAGALGIRDLAAIWAALFDPGFSYVLSLVLLLPFSYVVA